MPRRRATLPTPCATSNLDRFKVVNDTCGHTAGDNMLREVATIIKDAVRDSDTAAASAETSSPCSSSDVRWKRRGKSPMTSCGRVDDYRFVWKDKIFNIGVSIGLVEIGRGGGSIEDLMNSADSACYVAKKQGGVHVHVYSAREEANARHSGEIHWLQKFAGRVARQQIRALLPTDRARAQLGVERPGLEVFVPHGDRERPARRAAGGIHPERPSAID